MNSASKKVTSLAQHEINIRRLNLTHEELLAFAASLLYQEEIDSLEIEQLTHFINSANQALNVLKFTIEKGNGDVGEQLLEMLAKGNNVVADGLLRSQNYQKTKQARNAALARLRGDPKQKALLEIEQKYQAVKSSFKRHGYTAQFARDMHVKYPIFEDIRTIQNLVAKLNKSNELIPKK